MCTEPPTHNRYLYSHFKKCAVVRVFNFRHIQNVIAGLEYQLTCQAIGILSYYIATAYEGCSLIEQHLSCIHNPNLLLLSTVIMSSSMEVQRSAHDFSEALTPLWNHMLAFIDSICLRCAIELGVPDAMHNHGGPMTLSELVQALSISTSRALSLQRIMRVLVNSGFFSIKGNESDSSSNEEEVLYDLTATSKLLVTGSTNSLAPLVLLRTGLESAMAGQAMSAWIKGSDENIETPFHVAHGGKGLFEFASERPKFNALFNEAMACDSRVFMGQVVKEWGDVLFGGLRTLVDVGGGTGGAAAVIAGAFPEMKCLVLDLAHVVDVQPENELVEFVKGDMFVHVPPADAVLLKVSSLLFWFF